MTFEAKLGQLRSHLAEAHDLERAADLLDWDQQTYMPPGGAGARSEQLSILRGMAHRLFVSDEIGALLDDMRDAAADLETDSDEASLIRVTAREYEKARRVPPELVAELSRVSALAMQAWTRARPASDFALFRPHLEQVVALNVQLAEAFGYEQCTYDPHLDEFEPGVKTAQVAASFDELKGELVPVVKAIAEKADAFDAVFLAREYDERKQWEFGLDLLREVGFDFERGRQDRSAHPFTTSFSTGDVRLTTRVLRDYLPTALFATLHEGGHGLYDQGIDGTLSRTPLGHGASLAVHESQSRLWENLVGRSRGFWRHYFPRLRAMFPEQLAGVDAEAFYRAVNRVRPSSIRVEADEVTYNLHIFLRFELENDLLEGKVRVADLPAAWNAKMEEYLGITPANDGEGVLQDIHWASGLLGYFPTYALGNLLSVQFFDQALAENPSLPEQIESGQFSELLGWLRGKVHRHGRKFTPAELVRRVTGSDLQATPYMAYIRAKYGEIYRL